MFATTADRNLSQPILVRHRPDWASITHGVVAALRRDDYRAEAVQWVTTIAVAIAFGPTAAFVVAVLFFMAITMAATATAR